MPEPRKSRLIPEVDFGRDGKQTGFIRLFHSTHDSAYGFLPIPIVVVKNGDGPTALLLLRQSWRRIRRPGRADQPHQVADAGA